MDIEVGGRVGNAGSGVYIRFVESFMFQQFFYDTIQFCSIRAE
jgi:hypothetical protein